MENYKFVLFVNGEPVDYDDHPSQLLKDIYDNNCPLKISEEEPCYGGSEVAGFDDFCDWLDYHAGSYATCVRICNKNNELLDFFVINSFYTGEIPFFYCYDKNGNRVSDDVMRNRLIKYAKKNKFDCGSLQI